MLPDISLVLYRPIARDVAPTLRNLADIRAEFGTLKILVSGTRPEFTAIEDLVAAMGLFAQVRIEHRYDNLGFASGHNRLLGGSFEEGASSVLVLNPDISIEPGALSLFMERARLGSELSLFGPSLRRIPLEEAQTGRSFDSNGIEWTRSGRHFDISQGEEWTIEDGRTSVVAGVSGACLLVTKAAYDSIVEHSGWFFDDVFLAYREDAELGIRAGALGVKSRVIEMSGFGHIRTVRGAARGNGLADLLGVRNRLVLRWRLGAFRPGAPAVALLRDIVVVLAAATVERSSWDGVRSAYRIRRSLRRRGLRTIIKQH